MTAAATPIFEELRSFAPSATLEFYVLDLTPFGGNVFRFCAFTNQAGGPVVWQGQTYNPCPIKATGYDKSSNAQLPRPRLMVGNVGAQVTALCLLFGDLTGAKLTRKRTHAKYLDAVNFTAGNAEADDSIYYPDDVFIISQKPSERRDYVEFQLASALDLENLKIPRRTLIQNICPWAYRGSECGYTGDDYFDQNDAAAATLQQDVCGKRLSSCKLRFGANSELPFGGFPGTGQYR